MNPIALTSALPVYRTGMGLMFFLFTLPVLVPYYATKGISPAQFFYIEGLFRFAYFAVSLYAGHISDRWSRKGCLLLGSLMWWVGSLIILLSSNAWGVAGGEIMLASGMAFYVSSGRSYLYDLLLSQDRADQHPHQLSIQRALENGIRMLATAGGGFLFIFWHEAPQTAVLVSTALAFLCFMRLPEPPRHKISEGAHDIREAVLTMRRIIRDYPGIGLMMLYSAMLLSVTVIVFWGIQPVMRELDLPLQYLGLAMAGAAGATALFSRFGHEVLSRVGLRRMMIALLPIAVFELMWLGAVHHVIALAIFFVNSFVYAMTQIMFEDLLHRQVASDIRATTVSMNSMAEMLFSSVCLFAAGFLMQHLGLGPTFLAFAGFFALAGGFALTRLLRVLSGFNTGYASKP